MSKYRNTVFYDYQSRFLVNFSSNYRYRLVSKIPFPDHIFFKISKYRFALYPHFPFTGKCYATHKSIFHLEQVMWKIELNTNNLFRCFKR